MWGLGMIVAVSTTAPAGPDTTTRAKTSVTTAISPIIDRRTMNRPSTNDLRDYLPLVELYMCSAAKNPHGKRLRRTPELRQNGVGVFAALQDRARGGSGGLTVNDHGGSIHENPFDAVGISRESRTAARKIGDHVSVL